MMRAAELTLCRLTGKMGSWDSRPARVNAKTLLPALQACLGLAGLSLSGGALMPRSLADIDRDIGKASSQMRGALADLARLDHERRAHIATVDPKLTLAHRIRWYLSRS